MSSDYKAVLLKIGGSIQGQCWSSDFLHFCSVRVLGGLLALQSGYALREHFHFYRVFSDQLSWRLE